MKLKPAVLLPLAIFLSAPLSTYAAKGTVVDATLGTEANPAYSCSDLMQDGNFWIRAPRQSRYNGVFGYQDNDKVLTSCKRDGFQLISQFIDTDADELTSSQYIARGVEFGWLSGPEGSSTPARHRGISALTTDMQSTSGSFGLSTDVIYWHKGAHPITPSGFMPDVQVCFFELKEGPAGELGQEKCLDTSLAENNKRFMPLRMNTGKTGEYPLNALVPRPPRGQTASILLTSGEVILTLATWGGGVKFIATPGRYENDMNCWQAGPGKNLGSAGKFCEVAYDPGAELGCLWVAMNETGDMKTERLCFEPNGVARNELTVISDNKVKSDRRYGFRTYAKFWAPSNK